MAVHSDGDRTPQPPYRLLAATALGAFAADALLWASQIVPALRVSHALLFSIICWLFAWFCFGLKTSMLAPRYTWVSRAMAVVAALRANVQAPPNCRAGLAVTRKEVYLTCGYIAACATTAMLIIDALVAAGALHLRGLNFYLLTLFLLGAASESGAVRVLGPAAAAAENALGQASGAGAEPHTGALTVIDGGRRPPPPQPPKADGADPGDPRWSNARHH
jgi:hypothetical protein